MAVLLHGGFWRDRYGRGLMEALCADLASRGWAAWNLEYRRLGSGGGWPATFADVALGIDRLAGLAGEAPLDLGRVAAVGHSAGGHLALWAAARPALPAEAPGAAPAVLMHAVVSQAGVCDLVGSDGLALGDGVTAQLLGGSAAEQPERYGLASPAAALPLGVPQLLVHGEEDEDVPVAMSRSYHAAARAAGDPADLVVLPAIGHMEHIDPSSMAWRVALGWLETLPPGAGFKESGGRAPAR